MWHYCIFSQSSDNFQGPPLIKFTEQILRNCDCAIRGAGILLIRRNPAAISGCKMNFLGSVAAVRSNARRRERAPSIVISMREHSLSRATPAAFRDNLSREVYGVLGIPIDALDLTSLLAMVRTAVAGNAPFLLSTPNVNFLMMSRVDSEFRESLLMSDACPVDGMPIVWISRLLGVSVQKVSGCEIFDALRFRNGSDRPLNVFLFGGAEGLADTVSKKLNSEAEGMACVGAINPGFGSVADMSQTTVLDAINSSNADLLTVFLSAKKAQGWLLQNHRKLQVPFRAQFGATINLQAGTIKRAPERWRAWGFEWLWRIKEEPYLWRRYWSDGRGLLYLLMTCVLPLAISQQWRRLVGLGRGTELTVDRHEDEASIALRLTGDAVAAHVDSAISFFRPALRTDKSILIDLSNVTAIDARFFGLFLTVRKHLLDRGLSFGFLGATPRMTRAFKLNGFGFLLNSGK
jgi:N-acetylglucosaminyldiphosphoundecaprenol N-acetyl-beta-D-mannosaminyltransferase